MFFCDLELTQIAYNNLILQEYYINITGGNYDANVLPK